jgi:hypothetical protein
VRQGGGVFRHLLHVIPEQGARSIDFQGVVELWTASCGAVCVVLGDPDTAGRPPCTTCFPTKTDKGTTVANPSEEEREQRRAAAVQAALDAKRKLAETLKALAEEAEKEADG